MEARGGAEEMKKRIKKYLWTEYLWVAADTEEPTSDLVLIPDLVLTSDLVLIADPGATIKCFASKLVL
jgi:hypothetical protein